MRRGNLILSLMLILGVLGPQLAAQETAAGQAVPQLVRYEGVAAGRAGDAVEMVFRLYAGAEGGEALWTETQRVTVGADGRFTVLLGGATEGGLPQGVFAGGAAQWLGVSIERAEEMPRVKLASAEYAMQAADALALAGRAAADYVTQAQLARVARGLAEDAARQSIPDATAPSGSGTAGYLPLWTSASALGSSLVYQNGTGATAKLGLGTITPVSRLDVNGTTTLRGTVSVSDTLAATSAQPQDSPVLLLSGSTYSPSAGAQAQTFGWRTAVSGSGGASPTASFQLLYGLGPVTPAPTGLSISPKGILTFAAGQTFPNAGAGTITAVNAGTGLTGGGTSGAVTLNVDTSKVPLLGAQNNFTEAATFNTNGGIASLFAANGSTTGGIGLLASGYTGISSFGMQTGVNATSTGTGGTGLVATGGSFGLRASASAGIGAYGLTNGGSGYLAKLGYQAGVWGDSGAGWIGVIGSSATGNGGAFYNDSPSNATIVANSSGGSSAGVFYGGSAGHAGVYADNGATGGTALQGLGGLYGVYGTGTAANAIGVYGTAPTIGVNGVGTGGSDSAGVYGSGGVGLYGVGTQYGVYSRAARVNSGTAAGIYGQYSGMSSTGSSLKSGLRVGVGIWADSNADIDTQGTYGSPALLATADNAEAAIFLNNSNSAPAIFAHNDGSGGGSYGLVVVARGELGSCVMTGAGDASCTGTLNSTNAVSGDRQVETYAVQSSENWVEDFGSGTLKKGVATVTIEPAFAETVNTGVEYHVYLTPEGDSKGLYVTRKTASSFEVHESGQGVSSIGFDYRIVAKRVGHETERLADVTERSRRVEAMGVERGTRD